MIITFDIETLVYKCKECEYQFSVVGVWNSDMIWGKQVAKHCPACGSENLESL
jgi:Zn finger protein HypA/HybF involved in hydrogenase expression